MTDIKTVSIEDLKIDPVSAFRTGGGNPVGVMAPGGVVLFYMVSGFDLPSAAPSVGLSLREAQELVGVSHMTINRDIKAGKLEAVKNAQGHYEIDRNRLERFYAGRSPGSKVKRNSE